ncbi:formate dehydrogenase subunit gamma [Roseisalinus antarcticus]|uniref:NADP-reducing hydrogenase subunit HndA n=1 Tax=Roseisalinus antarcticus TaxID=254357 RepID=A0A1Y5S7B7_9RHOB|nr:formate dehydrogenase subunit gamma [Roseisalinus antarcticus]SLN34098.1 NADP-reducing hydrogenase subunit HndA [Roseisalinus antarcticus]
MPHAPDSSDIRALVAPFMALEGPLLPILHAVQAEYGHIPASALPVIADALNLTAAEVHGVVSFYHDFRTAPAGRHVLRICRAEACQAVGGTALSAHLLARLGVDWHGTTADGSVTVEPVYCLGLCACGPAVMVDDRVIGRVDETRADAMLAEVGA